MPYPARMSYVAWLKWRKETGSRPVSKRDRVSTNPEQEAALWRKVMAFLHDAGVGFGEHGGGVLRRFRAWVRKVQGRGFWNQGLGFRPSWRFMVLISQL